MILEEIEKEIQSIPIKTVSEAENNKNRLIKIRKTLLESTILDIDFNIPSRKRSLEICAKYNQARAALITYLLDHREEVVWSKFVKDIPTKIHSKQAIRIFQKVPQTILSDFRNVVENFILPTYYIAGYDTPTKTNLGYFSAIEILIIYSKEFLLSHLYYNIFATWDTTYLCKDSSAIITSTSRLMSQLLEYLSTVDLEDIDKVKFIQTHLLTKENMTLLKNNHYFISLGKLETILNERY